MTEVPRTVDSSPSNSDPVAGAMLQRSDLPILIQKINQDYERRQKVLPDTPPPVDTQPNAVGSRRFTRRKILGGIVKTAAVAAGGTALFEAGRVYQALQQVPAAKTAKSEPGVNTPSSPEPAPKPVENFNELIKPFIDDADKRRSAENDKNVDVELNSKLLNIGLSAWSEGRGESMTVLSYNRETGQITTVSLTRETITPEVIRFNKEKDQREKKQRKDTYSLASASNMFLYHTGGFKLMKDVIQDETGLKADFQFYMDEMFLHDFIKDFLGDKIDINIQEDIKLEDFDFDRRWSDGGPKEFAYAKGKTTMSAQQAMRFILSNNAEVKPGKYGHEPGRKNDLIVACVNAAMERFRRDPVGVVASLGPFILKQKLMRRIDFDFDLKLLAELAKKVTGTGLNFELPKVTDNDLMLNDPEFGDGGLIRVHRYVDADGKPTAEYQKAHPNMRKLLDKTFALIPILKAEGVTNVDDPVKGLPARGALPLLGQIAIGGDPDAQDLATGYWGSTRKLTKERLTKSPAPSKTNLPML